MLKNSQKEKNDSIIWEEVRSGNSTAYAYIYEKYAQLMFAYGYYFTKDKELIKDCIHDIFSRIYQKKENLGHTDNIKLYLYQSIRNELIQKLKRQSKYPSVDVDEISFSNMHFEENSFLVEDNNRSKAERITKLLNNLPPRQKEIIYYRYLEDLSLKDIALIMKMNYQSTQNLIQRALKKLQEQLTDLQNIV